MNNFSPLNIYSLIAKGCLNSPEKKSRKSACKSKKGKAGEISQDVSFTRFKSMYLPDQKIWVEFKERQKEYSKATEESVKADARVASDARMQRWQALLKTAPQVIENIPRGKPGFSVQKIRRAFLVKDFKLLPMIAKRAKQPKPSKKVSPSDS